MASMCWWIGPCKWSRPFAEGRRLRNGQFVRTGPDRQFCYDCGASRVSPVQFGDTKGVSGPHQATHDLIAQDQA